MKLPSRRFAAIYLRQSLEAQARQAFHAATWAAYGAHHHSRDGEWFISDGHTAALREKATAAWQAFERAKQRCDDAGIDMLTMLDETERRESA
jgi:hypothetical protein